MDREETPMGTKTSPETGEPIVTGHRVVMEIPLQTELRRERWWMGNKRFVFSRRLLFEFKRGGQSGNTGWSRPRSFQGSPMRRRLEANCLDMLLLLGTKMMFR